MTLSTIDRTIPAEGALESSLEMRQQFGRAANDIEDILDRLDAGSFGALAASGAVTGAGFVARFAAPGPIGSATPSTGGFTTLNASAASTFGSGFAARVTVTGGATAVNGGAGVISTAGTDINTHLRLSTKNAASVVQLDRPFIQSTTSSMSSLVGLRNANTMFWSNNNLTYAAAMAARFSVSGSIAGTITGANFAVNEFTIASDNVDATTSGGLSGFYVGHSAGGSNMKGNRTAVTGKVFLSTASPNQIPFRFITGGSFGAYTSVNPGVGYGYGYDESDGYIFGALLQARGTTGARFVRSYQGMEIDLGTYEVNVPSLDFGGIQVVMENLDVGSWMRQANAFGFANQTVWAGQGWGIGYAWVQSNGLFALNRTYGAVVGGVDTQYGAAPETAFGVDFFGLSLTQAHLRGYLNRVLIDGSGNIGGQVVAGTTLQTRSGVRARTSGVGLITLVDGSLFLTKPALTVGAPPGGGTQATADITTMAAVYMRNLIGGTTYAPGDTFTLDGGTWTVQAAGVVNEVDGTGKPTRITFTTAGSYTVLPAGPISTTVTSGVGAGLTLNVWWTALAVATTLAGDSYPEYPPPPVTAAYSMVGNDRSPLRRMEFNVAMVAVDTMLVLNSGHRIRLGHTNAAGAGTTQGSGTLVTRTVTYGTATAGQTAHTLPPAVAGDRLHFFCSYASAVNAELFPASGERIEALGANVATTVLIGTGLDLQCNVTGRWSISSAWA